MAAVCKRAKHALSDITSQNTPQEQSGGGGKKAIKRKAHLKNTSSPPGKRRKTTPQKQQQENLNFYRKLRMALVHHDSIGCTKSELDFFTVPTTQTSIIKGQWIEYHPLSNITDSGPIEFNVSGSRTGEEYLDQVRTQLYVKAKITKPNGATLDPDTQVGPVNLFLHSLFSQLSGSSPRMLRHIRDFCALSAGELKLNRIRPEQRQIIEKMTPEWPKEHTFCEFTGDLVLFLSS